MLLKSPKLPASYPENFTLSKSTETAVFEEIVPILIAYASLPGEVNVVFDISASVDCEATPVEFVRSRAGFGAVAVWFSKAPPSKVAPFDVTTPQRRKIVLEQDVFGPSVLVAKSLKVQEVKVADAPFSTDNTGFGVTGAN